MGAPNQELSQTADFIVNGKPDVPDLDDGDFVDIISAAIEILRGMKRHVSWPKITDELNGWLLYFTKRGDTLPPDLMGTRGLLLWRSYGGGEPYFFLGEDLKIYKVFRTWHDGSGRHSDDGKDWIYHTPVLRELTVEEFRNSLSPERYGGLLAVITTMVTELQKVQKGILDRAAYVEERTNKIEAIVTRFKQAEGL